MKKADPNNMKVGTPIAKSNKTVTVPTPVDSEAMNKWKAVEDSKVSRMVQANTFRPRKLK